EPAWTLDTELVLADAENTSDDTATAELREAEGADVDRDEDAESAADGPVDAATEPGRVGQRISLQVYKVVITDSAGTEFVAAATLDRTGPVRDPGSGMTAYAGPRGELSLSDAEASLLVEAVHLERGGRPRLHLSGHAGGDLQGVRLALVGRRQELTVALTVDGDSWQATIDLHQSQWGGPALLPRAGSYTLRAVREIGTQVRVACAMSLIARTPEQLDVPESRLRLEVGRGRTLRLRVGVTRAADELGSFHQRRLEDQYLGKEVAQPAQKSIYFESFYGRLATCNPYALDRVIARDHPDWTRYWGVTDLSVAVPEGATPVVEGTTAWFEARTTSSIVIGNDWFRRRFQPQPHQTVLQTWHGSMFKRIGLDRPAVRASTRQALLTERDKWDILLSQNHHSTEIFGTSYAWNGPVYEEGYPRNDPLATDSGEAIRERLGLRPDQRVVLYAPTWRDDVPGLVVFLDLARLAADLGEDYVILLRGHSRTVGHGGSVHQRGVIDVTTYPSITELFLVSDVLVTDYSSVMFDYSVTRRPMIFFVPDLDSYSDEVRGVYFDLAELAPGPLVTSHDEVVAAICGIDDWTSYAERYGEWVRTFNSHDDGHSSERVVSRLFLDHSRSHPPGLEPR
ncbi:MAG: CDP-glycerol glycerophosphotransferase family protein, partial [Ornithinimicrobium sp.]|uniref:CDP-glycerol glycerophosphotransferase family protein n=1 Tax=Ornithinimicrobium sp. TaxID=1977084 RepID=UPI0026E08201